MVLVERAFPASKFYSPLLEYHQNALDVVKTRCGVSDATPPLTWAPALLDGRGVADDQSLRPFRSYLNATSL
jgi:hypothetical protein